MEELLNLLQEFYGENRKFSNDDGILTMTNGVENLSGAYAHTYIISKQGGFIKRLVDNDKIDKSKVFSFIDTDDKPYEDILCLLALSDEPIEDLISYLK